MTASAPGRAASTGTLCGETAVGGADEPPARRDRGESSDRHNGWTNFRGSGQLHWRPVTTEPAAGRHHPCGLTAAGAHGDERAPKPRQNGGVPACAAVSTGNITLIGAGPGWCPGARVGSSRIPSSLFWDAASVVKPHAMQHLPTGNASALCCRQSAGVARAPAGITGGRTSPALPTTSGGLSPCNSIPVRSWPRLLCSICSIPRPSTVANARRVRMAPRQRPGPLARGA
jgi:hypothetical protein